MKLLQKLQKLLMKKYQQKSKCCGSENREYYRKWLFWGRRICKYFGKDQHESPEEIVAEDEQTEPVAETEEISEESKEDASITEAEPVITEEETAAAAEEEEGRGMKQRPQRRLFQQKKSMLMKRKEVAKEPEYQIKELFVREEEGSAQMDEEAAHKVKLASIKD